jgi:release factor glutamine methyltransferase
MTADEWIKAASYRLTGLERPRAEARNLLALALQVSPEYLFSYPETEMSAENISTAELFIERRIVGEPLSRISGFREFWSLRFCIGDEVLDPRPDTEILVEAGLEAIKQREIPYILDLGTGSGCILLALLSEIRDAFGIGIDRAKGACRFAKRNSQRLGLSNRSAFLCADWGRALKAVTSQFQGFDLIVTNPPYIGTVQGPRPDTATESFDPPSALYAGIDGLSAYKELSHQIPKLMAASGTVVIEIGEGQAASVNKIFTDAGLRMKREFYDLGGHLRCLTFKVA